jgi:hypothetical protein
VNENAEIAGGYQGFGTRQNSYEFFLLAWSWYKTHVYIRFFSSYRRGVTGWQYSMGNFALQAHPLVDEVELTVLRENSSVTDTFKVCLPCTISIFRLNIIQLPDSISLKIWIILKKLHWRCFISSQQLCGYQQDKWNRPLRRQG